MDPGRAVEAAARAAYGRLVAALAARSGDLAGAEDSVADALLRALETWPRDGVPADPDAWLATAARHRLIDASRRAKVRGDDAVLRALASRPAGDAPALPDERLELLFLCAHPDIEPAARTPLMLQAVLGLDAARIGSAFLVAPSTMGQRLVRAKARIRAAGLRFELPDAADLPERLPPVLDAIYAAYGTGWDDVAGADHARIGLAEEAGWLARVVVDGMPEQPEARGLLALTLFCDARRRARRGPAGEYVALSEQDITLWDAAAIAEAETHLAAAARVGVIGRYQLEAAIQSAHAARAVTGHTDWEAVALLYEGLVAVAPAVGARLGRAAALAEWQGPDVGLRELEAITLAAETPHQPYWALRASLLGRVGRAAEAAEAFSRAAGLTTDPAVRAFLLARAAAAQADTITNSRSRT